MEVKLIIGLIIFLILVSGCGEKEPLCKSPYIEYKSGECCLDQNNNGVCDNDEVIEEADTSITQRMSIEEEVRQMCSTGLANLELIGAIYGGDTLTITVDNKNEVRVAGFLFRIYGDNTIKSVSDETSIGAYEEKNYIISDITTVPEKVEAFPKVIIRDGSKHICTNELIRYL